MRVWFIARREMIQLLRDRRTIIVFVSVPAVLVLLFGYALSFDVRHLRTVVLDEDRTPASRLLVERFVQTGRFDLLGAVSSERELRHALDYGRAQVAVRIPPRYAQDLGTDRTVPVQVILDGSDPHAANVALQHAQGLLADHARRVTFATLTGGHSTEGDREAEGASERLAMPLQPVDPRIRIWYNPDLRDADFMIPGVVGTITSLLTMFLSAFSIARERELGTFEQLIVTPLQRVEIILGKLIPYAAIAFTNICIVIGTGSLVFGVPIRGDLGLLMALSLLFIMGSLGIGLFVSTISQTQAQVFPILIMNYLPNVLLSGFVFPIASMPAVIQPLTQVIPLTHYLVIIRGIMLKGMGIDAFIPQLTYLTVFCLGILTLSILMLHKKL
jgi:ABC-2 type transport system permease protein